MARAATAEPRDTQPFVVKRSRIQGRGGYATRDIRKGERVIEYIGERVSWAEADRRYDDPAMARHHTFLFTVNKRTIIDAAVNGNDARFINHSCAPNCEAIDEDGRIFIFAMKPIRRGAELTYDYAYPRDKDTTAEDEELYVCRCGARTCRGSILEAPTDKTQRAHHVASRQPHEHRKTARRANNGTRSEERSGTGTRRRSVKR